MTGHRPWCAVRDGASASRKAGAGCLPPPLGAWKPCSSSTGGGGRPFSGPDPVAARPRGGRNPAVLAARGGRAARRPGDALRRTPARFSGERASPAAAFRRGARGGVAGGCGIVAAPPPGTPRGRRPSRERPSGRHPPRRHGGTPPRERSTPGSIDPLVGPRRNDGGPAPSARGGGRAGGVRRHPPPAARPGRSNGGRRPEVGPRGREAVIATY